MRQQTYRGTGLLIMFMLIMACVWLVMPQRNQDQLTNQQFMQVLEDGNIQELVIQQNEQTPTGEVRMALSDGSV